MNVSKFVLHNKFLVKHKQTKKNYEKDNLLLHFAHGQPGVVSKGSKSRRETCHLVKLNYSKGKTLYNLISNNSLVTHFGKRKTATLSRTI